MSNRQPRARVPRRSERLADGGCIPSCEAFACGAGLHSGRARGRDGGTAPAVGGSPAAGALARFRFERARGSRPRGRRGNGGGRRRATRGGQCSGLRAGQPGRQLSGVPRALCRAGRQGRVSGYGRGRGGWGCSARLLRVVQFAVSCRLLVAVAAWAGRQPPGVRGGDGALPILQRQGDVHCVTLAAMAPQGWNQAC